MSTAETSARIAELEKSLKEPQVYPTEVYARIVGYYRSVANWNAGKSEEYKHRVPFITPSERVEWALDRAQQRKVVKPVSYKFFSSKTCPRCPSVKNKIPELGITGDNIDVASDEGFDAAVKWEVMVTPTLILLDEDQNEIIRITDVKDWIKIA